MAEAAAPIIVIKKKGGHHGHHGGAWKVAYADFVTAMMALFIVLWLMSSSEEVKKAVGGYFLDPEGNGKMMGSAMAGSGETLSLAKDDMKHLKQKLEQSLRQAPEFKKLKEQVQITVAGEGLRVELLESEQGAFFESGSPQPTGVGRQLLARLAEELQKLPNHVLIEGHTDAQPFAGQGGYSNWELSADRANAARRLMSETGVRPDQVKQVRGFADQHLRDPKHPQDARNRRISVIVEYQAVPDAAPAPTGEKGATAPKKAESHH